MAELYIAVRREGWFPPAMELSANLHAAIQMQIEAEEVWRTASKTDDLAGLRRSDLISQEAARVQATDGRHVQTWLTKTERRTSRKTRYIWDSARDGLLLQSTGLLLELMVWERQLVYDDPASQQELGAMNGHGIGHAVFGANLVSAIRARQKPAVVLKIAEEAHPRLKAVMETREYLLTRYPIRTSRWAAWANGVS